MHEFINKMPIFGILYCHKPMTKINEKILTDSGLTSEQTKIYLFLLESARSNAKIISKNTGTGRSLTYKILDQLVAMGLTEKRNDFGKITLFSPGHPQKLKDLVEVKSRSVITAQENLQNVFGTLASNYNLLSGKPNVQFYDGVDGLKKIYDDILDIGQDIGVISSPISENRTDVLHLIREQIEKQVAKNIKTKAITQIGDHKTATPIDEDEKFMITRREIPTEKLHIPAQIILYGDKVAITNFKESIISILIESKYIKETFEKMFEYIWDHS